MADTNFRGPITAMGALEIDAGTTATPQPFDGPSGFYQGGAVLDSRGAPFPAVGNLPGRAAAFLNNGAFWAVDNKPQAAANNVIAVAQVGTNALALLLATTAINGVNAGNPSIGVNIPIIPQGTTVVTTALALDFGFSTGTTTAASSTVVVADNTKFTVGQWVLISGVGNAANQLSQFTQVQTITTANTTGITVSPSPIAALNNAPIGQSNLYGATLLPPGTQFGPSTVTPTAISPNMQAGLLRVHNPVEALSRNLSITLSTGGVATAVGFLINGWDLWRMPMTELINVPATTSATTAYGQKAFKYINNIIPQSNPAGNTYSVGIGDTFGFPLRADEWEQTEIYWAGTSVTASTGTIAAITTVATNSTGDVRGTVQISTSGRGTAISGGLVSNGTSRLAIVQDVGVWNTVFATPINPVPMFGVTQSTT